MPCPFLAKLTRPYVNNYALLLLKTYGSQCPVMSRHMKTTTKEATITPSQMKPRCPFLTEVPFAVKPVAPDDDVIQVRTEDAFPYDQFFHHQITKKKLDHSYRVFKKVNRLAGPGEFPRAKEYSWGEKTITVWCSNDYLGMSSHPKVKAAVLNALERHGTGAGGTRNISGNSTLHEKLEDTLAKLHHKEAALLFTSCFIANESTLYTLGKMLPKCQIFSDEANHASMILGTRNSQVPKHVFRHNDAEHLEELLKSVDRTIPKIVAFETVYSMSGTICPLEKLCDVAHRYGALTFVDEVHAVGVYGDTGAGVGESHQVLHKMDIISATLGKAYGNIGGYVAAKADVINTLRSYAAGFIFTTSLPPTVVAGAAKAIEILASEEGRKLRKKHQENVKYLKKILLGNALPVENTPSHIIPIHIGDPVRCTAVCDALLRDKGHYVQGINYPTVARGCEKLRLAPTPYHSKDLMEELVQGLVQVWRQLKLPFSKLQRMEKRG